MVDSAAFLARASRNSAGANAQNAQTVEMPGTPPTTQNGLGFNLNPANEWEFQMAAGSAEHSQ